MKTRLIWVVFCAAFLVITAPAFATDAGFDFSQFGSNVDIANNGVSCASAFGCVAFTNNGFELDVTGFQYNGKQDDLFFKNVSAGEVGLGLVDHCPGNVGTGCPIDNEINNPLNFLQLDIAKLASEGVSNLIIGSNSTTAGETWGLSYSNTDGVLNNTVYVQVHSTQGTLYTVSTGGGLIQYLDFSSLVASTANGGPTGSGGNVLATSSPTPEPTSLLLLGSGLAGMGGMLRRKKKSA